MNKITSLREDIKHFIQYGDLPTSYYTKRGMVIGNNFNRQARTKFDPSHCWLIEFGDDVTVSNGVQILAHDDSLRIYTGKSKVGNVRIGNRVFIGAHTTILPGVMIGDDVIIGAGSLITKNIASNSIVAGVPAKPTGFTDEYVKRYQTIMESAPSFGAEYSYQHGVGPEQKHEMKKQLGEQIGFLEIGYFVD